MSFSVYRIFNRESKKIYIGSSENPSKREKEHMRMIKNKNHHSYKILFDSYWSKIDSWEFRVLKEFKTKEEMLKHEDFLIRIYFGRECSYNSSLGVFSDKTKDYFLYYTGPFGFRVYGSEHGMAKGQHLKKENLSLLIPGIYLLNGVVAARPIDFDFNLHEKSIIFKIQKQLSDVLDKIQLKQIKTLLIKAQQSTDGIYKDECDHPKYRIIQSQLMAISLLQQRPRTEKEILNVFEAESIDLYSNFRKAHFKNMIKRTVELGHIEIKNKIYYPSFGGNILANEAKLDNECLKKIEAFLSYASNL